MAAPKPFRALGLSDWIVQNVSEMGIREPTEVQLQCIPRILKGDDVIGQAKTGSGKTAAFALPILQKLSEDPFGVFAIVLTPSRELACQISDQFVAFAAHTNFSIVTIVGGVDMMKQSVRLRHFPQIIIATPGRLADHMRTNDTLPLNSLRFLVLDEADRMLEASFAPDLGTILAKLPSEGRQTLLFSATMTRSIQKLQELSSRPVFAFESKSDAEFELVERLEQHYMFIPQAVKECYLVYLLRQLIEPEDEDGSGGGGGGADDSDDGEDVGADAAGVRRRAKLKQQRAAAEQAAKTRKGMAGGGGGGAGGGRKGSDSARQQSFDDQIKQAQAGTRKPKSSAIIFVSTCKSCQILSEILLELEIPCVALHSQINQARRMAALGKFRAGQVRVLIATDVASRGLDIPSVQLVVNYDVPRVSADYVHRVGRTARAGRAGQAITLVTQYDLEVFAEVEALLGRKLTEKTGVAEADALASLRTVAAAKRMAAIRLESYALRTKQSLKRDGDEKQRRQAQKEKRTASAAAEVNGMGRGSDGRGPRGNGTAAAAAAAAAAALGGKRKSAESSASSSVTAAGSKRAKPAAAAAP